MHYHDRTARRVPRTDHRPASHDLRAWSAQRTLRTRCSPLATHNSTFPANLRPNPPAADNLAGAAGRSTVYFNLPKVTITMDAGSSGEHTGLMRLSLSIEVKRNDAARVPDFMPRIMDRIVSVVRSENYEELRAPGGERRGGAHELELEQLLLKRWGRHGAPPSGPRPGPHPGAGHRTAADWGAPAGR